MIMYSSYFVECFSESHEDWLKVDNMLRPYQWKTKDLNEAIAWAKIASLSTGVTIEVLQSECDSKTWTKEWYCLAIVKKCKVLYYYKS